MRLPVSDLTDSVGSPFLPGGEGDPRGRIPPQFRHNRPLVTVLIDFWGQLSREGHFSVSLSLDEYFRQTGVKCPVDTTRPPGVGVGGEIPEFFSSDRYINVLSGSN